MTKLDHRSPHHDTRERILATGEALIAGRGFSALGLSEILNAAAVPKGSFYHYFASKEGFGVALLERYFTQYQEEITALFADQTLTARERLLAYFNNWLELASGSDCHKLCLAVKLAAEVADLSEPMRSALAAGMQAITRHIATAIDAAQREQSINAAVPAAELAEVLYSLWVGASVLTKVRRDLQPLQLAMQQTERLLQVSKQ
ncbi:MULTISPECIES: TetR/AcrR family transcriptional regulator [unclassified Undibacterium]|uniref:TetR/AcrR family transcriptional regulator n=1 Tax=unclassified Undibacterium TaxID=2630295 RepID=UPI002AC9049D|nr:MULTISPECIES: TetR/AcrR family transcriptional regulator [unclassified Undibacterium]MEB0140282.1 TetR/AcrR family transcriptional regulator [Undibacterium sp. CCC2.1]MEB0173304.1 TetR/AcrR family transcriptional regulator [Undibacterium sp. CCC1.1]MEB0177123.1 TetR/AcrR family transcriptional regulator [Undibacterium sp. CCC3.4]MEB0216421.1 TetR/AcrR family transcriptional regulator [Undibacterium sp. 5I2]WPX45525.1 TetR/AcrR family transcriptional regulator [Undibacterium sp. CCC3.4]